MRLDLRTWCRALVYGSLVAIAIAIPTRLIPNDLFRRMTPTRPLDYAFWVSGAIVIGLVLALRSSRSKADTEVAVGGLGTTLAVGCPVCNKVVVAVIGVSGALDVFAPLQPLLGVASLALLVAALRAQLTARDAVCATARR